MTAAKKETDERRAPDVVPQLTNMMQAEAAGLLPDTDRRTSEPASEGDGGEASAGTREGTSPDIGYLGDVGEAGDVGDQGTNAPGFPPDPLTKKGK